MDQTPADAPGERPAARPAEQRAAAIGALADPVRRALYDHLLPLGVLRVVGVLDPHVGAGVVG
ncbi:hypothetical protein, partial [Ornithinicoccus halotolerans]|uniref:hypothetical protein n=1 Tax=Ornithinicoccus halotolerans TaxID=1748220 RepID=UPI001295956B